MKWIVGLTLLGVNLWAEPITIDQALEEAAAKNLNVAAERYNISIAEARVLQAGLRPNPVFSYGQDYQDVLGTGVTLENSSGPPEWNSRVDFILERGGKRGRRLAVAEAQKSVSELQFLNTLRVLRLDVEYAFVDALAARDSLDLARDNLKKLQDVVEVNRARVKSGDLAEVELMRTQIAARQFENLAKQAESRVRTTVLRLLLLMGRPALPEGVMVTGALREDRPLIGAAEVREAALSRRPDLLALSREQARSEADVKLQIAQGKSDFDLGVMYHNQYGYAKGQTMGFFFSAAIPVWNRNQGEVARARAEGGQIALRIRALRAQIDNEARTAYEQYVTSRELVDSIERNMLAQARQVRDTTEYSYLRGEATFVEFLDAARALNDTMQSYNDARAEYARNLYLLEAVSGQGVQP